MILISESLMVGYYINSNDDVKLQLNKKLSEKKYTVKDSTLSYRQINSLGASAMLQDERENERGWRKFSFKDLVYLYTILEFRKYGIENDLLQELRDDFYKHNKGTAKFSDVDHVLLLVLGTVKISLILTADGRSWFVDTGYQTVVDSNYHSYTLINFNEIVRKVWKLTKGEDSKFPSHNNLVELMANFSQSSKVSDKENEILDILRNKNYSLVTIKKKDKNTFNVYGELEKNTEGMTEIELIESMKEKDFTNIKITKRDGKIVSYKLEDVYKI